MSRWTQGALVAVQVVLAVVPVAAGEPATAASGRGAVEPRQAPVDSRVRGLDPTSRKVLAAAVACSPTVASMVAGLEASDLLVGVELARLEGNRVGETRLVTATPDVRYVRVRLRPNGAQGLAEVLGHELRHATEIAAAREVRDADSQRSYYLRVGYERTGGGRYETDAALVTGRLVAREVASCPALR
jgi:hypothetical protein